MKIKEAIARARKLSGNAVEDDQLCRWLSELDGRLFLDFYRGCEWLSYHLPEDEEHELIVPFPWDDMYVHYLAAMVYQANGEYERYREAAQLYNQKELDYRKWYNRNLHPPCPQAITTRDCTIVQHGRNTRPFWYLSAYGIAVRHGFKGTEEEFLEELKGEKVQLQYDETEDQLEWKYEEDEEWQHLMDMEDIRGPIVSRTIEQAQKAAADAAEHAATATEGAEAAEESEEAAKQARDFAEVAAYQAEAAASQTAQDAETAEEAADQATEAADLVIRTAASVEHDAEVAETARRSIENMTVSAENVGPGAEATVEKTLRKGIVNLHFGIPQGLQGVEGPEGKQGVEGPPGPQGPAGLAVESKGIFAFNVTEDGHLHLYYTGEEIPNIELNEEGHLIAHL